MFLISFKWSWIHSRLHMQRPRGRNLNRWPLKFPALQVAISPHGSREPGILVLYPDLAQKLHKLQFRPVLEQPSDIWFEVADFFARVLSRGRPVRHIYSLTFFGPLYPGTGSNPYIPSARSLTCPLGNTCLRRGICFQM